MSNSVGQLVTRALRIISYIAPGDDIPDEIMQVGLESLDGMVDAWSNDPLMTFKNEPVTFPIVPGQKDYTLGPGGDWNITRPMVFNEVYVNWNSGGPGTNVPQQVDLPVAILNVAQYAAVSVKNTPTSFAFALYEDGNYPLRKVSLWPIPNIPGFMTFWFQSPLIDMGGQEILAYRVTNGGTGYVDGLYPAVRMGGGSGNGAVADFTVVAGIVTTVALTGNGQNFNVNDTLNVSNLLLGGSGTGFELTVDVTSGNLTTPVTFPPGYYDAFCWNLAVRLAPELGKKLTPEIIQLAIATKAEIARLNAEPQYLSGDGGLTTNRNKSWVYIVGGFVPWRP